MKNTVKRRARSLNAAPRAPERAAGSNDPRASRHEPQQDTIVVVADRSSYSNDTARCVTRQPIFLLFIAVRQMMIDDKKLMHAHVCIQLSSFKSYDSQ